MTSHVQLPVYFTCTNINLLIGRLACCTGVLHMAWHGSLQLVCDAYFHLPAVLLGLAGLCDEHPAVALDLAAVYN